MTKKTWTYPVKSNVTVILTSYNRPHLVSQAIQSVLNQTYKEWSLVVIDDASHLETQDILNDFEKANRFRILVVHRLPVKEEERARTCRYAESINIGISKAPGEFITYLSDDDLYAPTRLERMVKVFEDPNVHVVYGPQSVQAVNAQGPVVDTSFPFQGIRLTFGRTRNPHCRIDQSSFMHRSAILKQLDKPYWPEGPENWHDGDGAFYARIIALGYEFVPVEGQEPTDIHRWHKSSVQSRMNQGLSPVYEQEF